MELYLSVYYLLAWSMTVAILGLVTFPWGILAYKIWHGAKPIDEDLSDELLIRSFYAGWALAFSAIVFVVFDFLTVEHLQLPSGPVHLVYYLGFVAFASWLMIYFFSMEDFIQALILTIIYFYLPALVLVVISLIFRNPLYDYLRTWLILPTE